MLFTKGGKILTLNQDWCRPMNACPNFTNQFIKYNENVSDHNILWKNSRVIGLSKIDASCMFQNPHNHFIYVILVQLKV